MNGDPLPDCPWRPTPLLAASMALQFGLAAAAVARPRLKSSALKISLANQGLMAVAGMLPRSSCLGRTVVRFSPTETSRQGVALTFDDGPDPRVTPRVLDLLDAFDAKATFFCIGRRVEHQPKLAREIHRRGHRLENHTFNHSHTFAFRDPQSMKREILRGRQAIEDATGRRPEYFRSPAGMRNLFLDPVLHGLGLSLVAWTRRGFDTTDGDVGRVVSRLARGVSPGDILLLHDGNGARTAGGRPVCLPVLKRLLELFERRGLRSVALPDGL